MTKIISPSFKLNSVPLGKLNLEDVANLSSADLSSFPCYLLLTRYANGRINQSSGAEVKLLRKHGYVEADNGDLTLYGKLALGRIRALYANA